MSSTLNRYILILHPYVCRPWVMCSICTTLLIALYLGMHSIRMIVSSENIDAANVKLL
jgi:hypothetical protein